MNNNVKIFVSVIAILVLGTVATAVFRAGSTTGPSTPGKYDAFATCLKDKGAVFYGAFWCPHCQAQKKLFGTSVKLLPYVECSTADASGQTQICIDKKVGSYPTWEFADGSRLTGEIPLEQLASKTSCILPVGDSPAPVSTGGSSKAQ
jgi:thiol-disulfide isomerase/thioredoxin